MGIRDRAISDSLKITTNKTIGAAVDMTITSRKNTLVTGVIAGFHTRHHLSVDSEGNASNDLNAHCTIHELELQRIGYPVRNANGLVDIKGDEILAPDNMGVIRKYKIAQVHPDQTFGPIRCILEDCV